MSTLSYTATSLPVYDKSDAPDWFLNKAGKAWKTLINLAPLKYAFVTDEEGPIERIEYGSTEMLGETWQLCRALLQPEYQHPLGDSLCLFHPADGSGVGKSRIDARARAVSEALERWAYTETSAGTDHIFYGYQYANSTRGMAAFPGLWNRPARRLAMAEAYEHHAVDAWWDGQLSHYTVDRPDSTVVFINAPEFQGYVALAIRHLNNGEYVAAYGIGSGDTPESAELKAQLEASRMESILLDRARIPSEMRLLPVIETEQRILYFSSKEGQQQLKDRINTTPWKSVRKAKVVFDGQIQGPWNKYAQVWRYALEPISDGWSIKQFAA